MSDRLHLVSKVDALQRVDRARRIDALAPDRSTVLERGCVYFSTRAVTAEQLAADEKIAEKRDELEARGITRVIAWRQLAAKCLRRRR
jgi:hypothetical protein